jgi:hypothetical protein
MIGKRTAVAGFSVLVLLLMTLVSSVALAHNAGHIFLPSGVCVDVGSSKHGPLVNQNAPHIVNPDGTYSLDLIPGPGDQYGARFAATRGNTPIRPSNCPS